MLNASSEFINLVANNSKVYVKATLTFFDGTVRNLEGDDFMEGGVSFRDAVSSSGSFDIGAAIINQCTITLNNYDERFSDYDFTGAKIEPYIGVKLSNGTMEWLKKGVFWVENPSAYPSIITLTTLDNMSKFERDYSEINTHYPATLRSIVQDICSKYNITLANTNFSNCTYSVPERPQDDALTCLDVIAAAAQCAGCWARMDNQGRLKLDWYDLTKFETEEWIDGGNYSGTATPYATGDSVDGGDFTSYETGAIVDGGSFTNRGFVVAHGISSSTITTDDVVITGVEVTELDKEIEGSDTLKGKTKLFGSQGYVLSISNNPLIQYGQAEVIANYLGLRIVGMRFRPFDISALGSPAYEAGDPIIIIDAKLNTYKSFVTSLIYKVGAYEAFACSAETPSRNSASGYSSLTKALVKLRNEIEHEKTSRELALENFANRVAANNGLFMTTESAENGGSIFYMHDKAELSESQYVWKMTADAIAISIDGGQTYSYGLDVDGNAILERIYTVGLDADYINTGALEIKKGDDVMFKADYDTGEVYISADSLNIALGDIDSEIKASKVFYATCSTSSSISAKTATCTKSGFKLQPGATVMVFFSNKNTAANPTLNINNTGAEPIWGIRNFWQDDDNWNGAESILFVYAGNHWQMCDSTMRSAIKATKDEIAVTLTNYATTSQLQMTADSITAEITGFDTYYATCSTASNVRNKVVSCPDLTFTTGVTIAVTFDYGNTVTNPALCVNDIGAITIYKDGSPVTSQTSWKAGDTVLLFYDGNHWCITESGLSSMLQLLRDKITLTVTKGEVSSQLSVESGAITITSNRFSWESTYTSMTSTGHLTCKSGNIGGFIIDQSQIYNSVIRLNQYGLWSYRDGTVIGSVGNRKFDTNISKYGLHFQLEPGGSFIDWGVTLNNVYYYKLIYASQTVGSYAADTLHVGCSMDLHKYYLKNAFIDGESGAVDGVTATSGKFILPTSVTTQGSISSSKSGCYLKFRRGFVVEAVLP